MTTQNENNELNAFIDKFISQVVADLKMDAMTPEFEKELREMIRDRVEKRLMSMIINNLPDEEFNVVIDKLEKAGITEDEEVQILSEAVLKIPDFAEKFKATLKELHAELTEDAAELRKRMSGG
ncbi:MAG: hypothetical protein UT33_C0017G0003 [Candidatus Peregrinibacteria bacterium GW2011_GWC2_39_14]|nr:MAG: hypothetical protein US92_C0007G0050 [Candidatus Peregrinibacteria bacterium GW2011_GWA2_38_36]KKR04732.1 MAG: hypothetical protein UT33_C0017G0003 [Candidatus Peregrinibacteria bacterium GW2011_GWC2_39_14]